MNAFALVLQDSNGRRRFDDVVSFVAEDASGSFGICPGHVRMWTVLVTGLARFRVGDGHWTYVAVPGAVLEFSDNFLLLSCRHYLIDEDYTRISRLLQEQLLAEEAALQQTRRSLRHMEETVLRRMLELGERSPGWRDERL